MSKKKIGFIDLFIDEEISIGDFVLTGGEIPAMVFPSAYVLSSSFTLFAVMRRMTPEVISRTAPISSSLVCSLK